MGWQVDNQTKDARDFAVSTLKEVLDQDAFVFARTQTMQVRSGFVTGRGHEEGDRLAQDLVQVMACLHRALSSIDNAIQELNGVQIMEWVSDDDDFKS